MTAATAVIIAALVVSGAQIEHGWASQYDPGVMAQVVVNRQSGLAWPSLPLNLPPADGAIAVACCDDIGQLWWVKPTGGTWGRYLVADCAGAKLRDDGLTAWEWMQANNVLLEFARETVAAWGWPERRGIEVEVIRQ